MRDKLILIGDKVLNAISNRVLNYVNLSGGLPVDNTFTSRTGLLLGSVQGKNDSAIREVSIQGDRMGIVIGTKVPYALLIEKGGTRPVTDRMRRFFWAKYYESKGDPLHKMWSVLRFKDTIVYKPRPYLGISVRDIVNNELRGIFAKELATFIKVQIRESIK